ncbi:uncharacterized protein N7496_007793 [Penicillium cataractarum]|uniref:Mid2 domain-containing protein n=1 Tax=Penicillium cataractarum TaxID=2100454 RepID=A0A9W9V3Y6_9EURO|nr:uncharacterized protein N7496_007793 [Penicillium cataractarum]KAJ5368033.1 hypothetical protein N7496_007793 [Penicillium cataractarum]
MAPSASAVDQDSPASPMASVNKDRIFFEGHAQIPHGKARAAQSFAQAVSHSGSQREVLSGLREYNDCLGRQLDNWMSSCPGVGSGYFCCGVDDSCCKNSTLILDLGFGTAITTASSTSTSSTSTASNQPTSTIASSQTTSASSNLPSTHNNNVQVNGNDTPGTNVALAAGVGAGVGLPVCAAIVAFIFFCRRRHRQVALDKDFSESQPRKLPLRELESNAPRSEVGSTALCELSTASLCELSTARG